MFTCHDLLFAHSFRMCLVVPILVVGDGKASAVESTVKSEIFVWYNFFLTLKILGKFWCAKKV